MSRKTFYDLFHDREDCFVAAYEQAFSGARATVVEAYEQKTTWREGVRAALGRLLALMDEHPGLTRMCVVHSLAGGERVQLRRERLMAQLVETVDLGRGASPLASELPRIAAEAVVGGIHAIIHRRLVHNDQNRMVDLLGPLMSMIVLPYLGPEVACEERRIPYGSQAPVPGPRRQRDVDPLSGLHIRLTYRTVRVLIAVAERPEASNREIAAAAGITDQGQMSKLLSRLARLGLIKNQGEGQAKGGANAWLLTAQGARLERATRPRLM